VEGCPRFTGDWVNESMSQHRASAACPMHPFGFVLVHLVHARAGTRGHLGCKEPELNGGGWLSGAKMHHLSHRSNMRERQMPQNGSPTLFLWQPTPCTAVRSRKRTRLGPQDHTQGLPPEQGISLNPNPDRESSPTTARFGNLLVRVSCTSSRGHCYFFELFRRPCSLPSSQI
jgi:hypothetical protein